MMQAGVPIWDAAGFLGMTTKTLEKVYGHHDPAFQDQAANIESQRKAAAPTAVPA